MKKSLSLLLAAAMSAALLAGCSSSGNSSGTAASQAETTAAETTAAETTATGTTAAKEAETAKEAGASQAGNESEASATKDAASEGTVRIGGLKGPTTMGLVKLMDSAGKGETENNYEFTMVTAADELTALVGSGKVDIALLPANVASVLYNKTGGKISVIDINTLGVLYLVSADTSIQSIDQLKGKTVYLPGKGTTPEFALRYLISKSGLSELDVTLEFKSEATEVAAVLAEDPNAVGLLPQPFVTVALTQNEKLSIVMDLTEVWNSVQEEGSQSRLVTGVTIVNNEFLKNNQEAVDTFLSEHEISIEFTADEPDAAAELIAAAGIVPKAPIAKKALPYCNITYMDGSQMKDALSGYLSVLFEQNPASVGGTLPDDAFYYLP